MLTVIYQGIIALLMVFILWNMWRERDMGNQAIAAMVIIPLLLRLIMIK